MKELYRLAWGEGMVSKHAVEGERCHSKQNIRQKSTIHLMRGPESDVETSYQTLCLVLIYLFIFRFYQNTIYR